MRVGMGVGVRVSMGVGMRVGMSVGMRVGMGVGMRVGMGVSMSGMGVGMRVSMGVGMRVSMGVGMRVGMRVGEDTRGEDTQGKLGGAGAAGGAAAAGGSGTLVHSCGSAVGTSSGPWMRIRWASTPETTNKPANTMPRLSAAIQVACECSEARLVLDA